MLSLEIPTPRGSEIHFEKLTYVVCVGLFCLLQHEPAVPNWFTQTHRHTDTQTHRHRHRDAPRDTRTNTCRHVSSSMQRCFVQRETIAMAAIASLTWWTLLLGSPSPHWQRAGRRGVSGARTPKAPRELMVSWEPSSARKTYIYIYIYIMDICDVGR